MFVAEEDIPRTIWTINQLNKIVDGGYDTNDRVIWINRLNYTYASVVRHPLERVKSHFYFHRSMKTDPNHHWTRGKELAEWVGFMEDSMDCTVVHIAGIHSKAWWNIDDETVGPLLPGRTSKMAPRNWIITWDHYLMARRNLIGMGWVGVFERLTESVDQLKHFWGIQNKIRMPIKNRNKRKPKDPLTQEEIDKIIAFNMGDAWLHELALVLFQQQELVIKYSEVSNEP